MESEEFVTDAVNLAAFFMVRGLKVLRVERLPERDNWARFVFGPEAWRIASEYRKNPPVPVRDFANALRDIKTLIRLG